MPATDGASSAAKFGGPRTHRVVPNVGHNLPQEAPEAFANAVWELVSRLTSGRQLFDYIEVLYNQRRRSTLGQISPAAFEREATTHAA